MADGDRGADPPGTLRVGPGAQELRGVRAVRRLRRAGPGRSHPRAAPARGEPAVTVDVLNDRERPFQAMCARVALTGFALDPGHIRAKITEHSQAREDAAARVRELCPDIT